MHATCFRGLSPLSAHNSRTRQKVELRSFCCCLSPRSVQCRTADGVKVRPKELRGSHCVTSRLPHTHTKCMHYCQHYTYGHTKTLLSVHIKHLVTELTKCNSVLHRFPSLTTVLPLLLLYLKSSIMCTLSPSYTLRTVSMFLPHLHAALHAQYCTYILRTERNTAQVTWPPIA